MKEYLTVGEQSVFETTVKHSRFIATCGAVCGKEEAAAFVARVSKKYSDATHNCYAYVADSEGRERKFSDNGEPSGTAGQPIMDVLQKNSLCCACLVVTRYFGGIKLGAAGLVGAYSQAAAGAVKNASILRMTPTQVYGFSCAYSTASSMERLVYSLDVQVLAKDYRQDVFFKLAVAPQLADKLIRAVAELTSGKGSLQFLGEQYYAIKL